MIVLVSWNTCPHNNKREIERLFLMIKEMELSLLMYILFQGRASPTSTNHWCFNCGDLLYSSCVGERTCGRTRAIQFSVQKRTMVNAKDFLLFSPLPGLVWKYHNRYQNLTIFYHIFLPYFYTISCIRLIFLIFLSMRFSINL